MKRSILFVLLIVLTAAAVFAEGPEKKNYFFMLNARVAPVVGLEDYLRGMAGSIQMSINLLFFRIGAEAILEYDTWFNTNQATFLAQLGFGKNFWLSAGYAFPLGDAPFTDIDGDTTEYIYGEFPIPNTFGLGFRVPVVDLGFARLGVASNLTYTYATPSDGSGDGFSILNIGDFLLGILMQLKGYFAVEMSFGF